MLKISQNNKDYSIQNFHGANKKYSLICKNRKIVTPKQLEKQVIEWYHNALYHPRETCTELSISHHFYWKNLLKTVHEICTKCKTCQFLKRNKKQCRKLPPKAAEIIPWDTLCVDLIGKHQFTLKGGGRKFQIVPKGDERKYKITTKSGRSVYLQAVTMIDLATGWIEIHTIPLAQADLVSNQVELAWLAWYLLSNMVIVDKGNEFPAKFREMIINEYGIMVKLIISGNP